MKTRMLSTAVALLLVSFAALCMHGALRDSPTVDEFAHLPAGYWSLKTGRFDSFPLNPPLAKVLAALPLLALDPAIDTTSPVENQGWFPWIFATGFMEQNRAGYERIFVFGRLPIVGLGILLGLFAFLWARELYGDRAALVALYLIAFCPSFIAHSHVVTTDVAFTAFTVLALWTLHRFVYGATPLRLAACGLALGVAQLSKMSALLLYPVFLVLAATALAGGERFPPLRRSAERGSVASSLASLAIVFGVSLLVLDAGYLFRGVGVALRDQPLGSATLRGIAAHLPGGLPVPLPAAYLVGLDDLQVINESGEFQEYLFGQWSKSGSPAYYLLSIVLKTPLPQLLALLLAPFARAQVAGARSARGEIFLWLPAVALLGWFSLFSSVHYGIRYVLPTLALLAVWSARLVRWLEGGSRWLRAAGVTLLVAYPLSALIATPDTISYFNLLAGGRGDEILLDSNLDWGQGLKRVRDYMRREGIDDIGLLYFGHVDPAIYGIRWHFPKPDRAERVAVSANFLHGYGYVTYAGRIVAIHPDDYAWLAGAHRVADLGGGMFVVEVKPSGSAREGSLEHRREVRAATCSAADRAEINTLGEVGVCFAQRGGARRVAKLALGGVERLVTANHLE